MSDEPYASAAQPVVPGRTPPQAVQAGGEMGERIRAFDWAGTALGPVHGWCPALRSAIQLAVDSPLPTVVAWGPALTCVYNDAYCALLGGKPDALGRPFLDVWPEAAEAIEPLLRRALAGQASNHEAARFILRRGGVPEEAWFDYSLSPLRDGAGEIVGVLNQGVETTGRVLAEQARVHSEQRLREVLDAAELSSDFRALFDAAPTPLLALAPPDWTIVAANHARLIVTGTTREGSIGRKLFELFPDDPNDPEADGVRKLSASLERVVDTRAADVMADQLYAIRNADGRFERRWWSPVNTPVLAKDGAVVLVIHRVEDVTDAKVRAAELEAAQEALRQSQKMEAIGQLTGGVAHDFNNLLTPIVGSLDLLRRRGLGNAREQQLIQGAIQSAERARVLVQRLLAFARRQPLQPVPVDIARLVTGMAELVASTTGPQIKVVVEVPEGLPAAKVDANQVEMALLNLAVNARDAMPDGGVLRISAHSRSLSADHDGLRAGDYIQLSVADTGVGMDEATRARAVEPFYSTKGVGKGTGLGLSMVDGLAAQLGGTLRISSAVGLGTNIELWLPQTSADPVTSDPIPPAPHPTPAKGTVLLVDDEELVRFSTAAMLTDLGYHVVEVGSAEEALGELRNGTSPDMLVTDHLMPGMTGADLARAVRAERPGLPVLLISGYAEHEGIAPGLHRLTKPFREDELAASLARL